MLHFFAENRDQSSGTRPRRNDAEERLSSGRRWTTSRNSHYQKIVSSYEQEAPEDGRDDADQAKAKSSKRKPMRTSALSHDQIASETSVVSENEKADLESNAPAMEDGQADKKPTTMMSRRRSSVGTSTDMSSEQVVDQSTVNPKKRRRIVTTTSTSTLAPQTMSDSLYQYFRPLEKDVPQDDIIPFLDFGRKLSPVIPTPSGANSIDSKSTITKLRPRNQYEEKDSHSPDEELLQEDMDVTVVKKAIERNSVPRAKLRVREQGISDYYRKKGPAQVRTTENIISFSDSSTASTVPNEKHIGVLKKINRHQIHLAQPLKSFDEHISDHLSSAESTHSIKNIEVLHDKRRQYIKPIQRLAAIKQEHPHSPLTAESTLVKTIIKELPKEEIITENYESTTDNGVKRSKTSDSTVRSTTINTTEQNTTPIQPIQTTSIKSEQKSNSKVLSTAVVTSVSVQESLESPQIDNVTEYPKETAQNNKSIISPLPLSALDSNITKNESSLKTNLISQTNISEKKPLRPIIPSVTKQQDFEKSTTMKVDTPLRSRDIYKPKTIPPGSSIPHLPRIIPNTHYNISKTNSSSSNKFTTERGIKEMSKADATTSSTTNTATTIPTTSSTTTTTHKPPHSTETPNESTTLSFTTTPVNPPLMSVDLKHTELNNATKDVIVHDDLDRQFSTVQATVQEVTTQKGTSSTEVREMPSTRESPPSTQSVEDTSSLHPHKGREEQSSQRVETEYVPPPKNEEPTEPILIVPVVSSDDKIIPEDRYEVYFTIPPTSTIPVVDTRPDTEAEVVEDKNVTLPASSSTQRPGEDWVKLGAVEKEVEVVYPEPMGLAAYMLAALGVVPVLIGALVGARFLVAHNKKKVSTFC